MLTIHRNNKRPKTSAGQEMKITVQVYKDNMGQGRHPATREDTAKNRGKTIKTHLISNVRDGKHLKLNQEVQNTKPRVKDPVTATILLVKSILHLQ